MENTVANRIRMNEVMADLREEGARCCLLYTGRRERTEASELPKYVQIRTVLKDGRIWDIHDIKTAGGRNEAIVTCPNE